MTDDQQRARELLAQSLRAMYPDDLGLQLVLRRLADDSLDLVSARAAVEAITAALRAAPEMLQIQVRNNGEYGSFFVREGVSGEGDRMSHWCELTCNTSFGTVGYYWSSMGSPAKDFFKRTDYHYIIGKLWMNNSTVFDGAATEKAIRKEIIRLRREGEIEHEDAAHMWSDTHLIDFTSNSLFERSVTQHCDWLVSWLCEGIDLIQKETNPQAAGFMKHLWPLFVEELNKEPS